tara:strand:- start:115 stop:915 length:801 start_codon:yes stop_codon:yes gene_type:complete
VVELDGKPTLDDLLRSAGDDPSGGTLEVVQISAADALDEYLRDHGFQRIAKRLNKTGVIDMIGTAAPGIDDVVVLGKIKQYEQSGDYDVIVVDGPAAGHAITFLTSATGLANAVRSGPVRTQSDGVIELLTDVERCQVVLVTLAETTPVNEVVETAFALEDDVGVQLGPIVVNAVDDGAALPDVAAEDAVLAEMTGDDVEVIRAAAAFRRSRRAIENTEIRRLASEMPLVQLHIPARLVAGLTSADIDLMADALTESEAASEADRG